MARGRRNGGLCSKHPTAGCARVHADIDGEHQRQIQVDVHGDARGIPHTRRSGPAAWALDAWKRPTDLANRTWGGVNGSLTGLDQTRALVRLQPGSPNVNSALSEMAVRFRRNTHHLCVAARGASPPRGGGGGPAVSWRHALAKRTKRSVRSTHGETGRFRQHRCTDTSL